MSLNSLALTRSNASKEITDLASQHLQHDLTSSDRDRLKSAAGKFGTHATVGSIVGLGLGFLLALRVRRARVQVFKAYRAAEKPTHVRFADGREEAIPDISPTLAPSALGDLAAYLFFGAGGLFLGGEMGLLTGSAAASRTITGDEESKARIESAFRRFKADVLRKEAESLEALDESGSGKKGVVEMMGL